MRDILIIFLIIENIINIIRQNTQYLLEIVGSIDLIISISFFDSVLTSEIYLYVKQMLLNIENYNYTNFFGEQANYNILISISPWFITWLTDAESSFTFSIGKNSSNKLGWNISLSYQIELHARDISLLETIQNYFKVVTIIYKNNCVLYRVRSKDDLAVIFNHFNMYPLSTLKKKKKKVRLLSICFSLQYVV